MFKEMAALANLMKNASQLAGQAGEVKQRLASLQVVGHYEGVQVVATGDHKILSISIAEEVHLSGSREQLEQCILKACNAALTQARDAVAREMQGVASDLGVAGLGDAMSKFGFK